MWHLSLAFLLNCKPNNSNPSKVIYITLELPNLFDTKVIIMVIGCLTSGYHPVSCLLPFTFKLNFKVALGLSRYLINAKLHFHMCPQLWVCFTNSDTTLLTYFQPLFITMPHRSFLAPLTHSQLFLLFSIYLLVDLYSAFFPENFRPIKYYTSKIKLKMGKVGKQIGIENLRDNRWLGEREEGCSGQFIFLLLVCHSENLSIVRFFFSQVSDPVSRCLKSFLVQKR